KRSVLPLCSLPLAWRSRSHAPCRAGVSFGVAAHRISAGTRQCSFLNSNLPLRRVPGPLAPGAGTLAFGYLYVRFFVAREEFPDHESQPRTVVSAEFRRRFRKMR